MEFFDKAAQSGYFLGYYNIFQYKSENSKTSSEAYVFLEKAVNAHPWNNEPGVIYYRSLLIRMLDELIEFYNRKNMHIEYYKTLYKYHLILGDIPNAKTSHAYALKFNPKDPDLVNESFE
jgi:hypothetical protein